MGLGLGTRLGEYKEPTNQVPAFRMIKGSVTLNGSNDAYYDTQAKPTMDHELGMSIAGCFKIDNVSTGDVLVAFDSGLSGGEKTGIGFFVGNSHLKFGAMFDDIGASYYWDDAGACEGKASTSTISADTWYHLVGTAIFKDAAWTTKFYINGVAQTGAFSWNNHVECGSLSGYGIIGGDRVDISERRFAGSFNNIAIWRGVIGEKLVSSLYNNGKPRSPLAIMRGPGPVASLTTNIGLQRCWRFENKDDDINRQLQTGVPPSWQKSSADFDFATTYKGDSSTDYMGKL